MTSEKRGWLLDQIMLIGHYEAALTHDDEQICNLEHDKEANSGEIKEIERIANEVNFRTQLMAMHYEARKQAELDIFEHFLDIDKKKWCDIKHAAAAYVLAAEVYHARDFEPAAERNLIMAGKALAFLISYTFGFEPMDCLRCLSEAINEKEGNGYTIAPGPIEDNRRPEYKIVPES